jgi:nucleoid-associated protein YgaU
MPVAPSATGRGRVPLGVSALVAAATLVAVLLVPCPPASADGPDVRPVVAGCEASGDCDDTMRAVHVVVPGETLWSIAVKEYAGLLDDPRQAGHQWRNIAAANHLRGTTIRPGQRLLLPLPDVTLSRHPAPRRHHPHGPAVHVVVRGETLWRIAVRAYGDGTRWRQIAAANGLPGSLVRAGQALTLPPR